MKALKASVLAAVLLACSAMLMAVLSMRPPAAQGSASAGAGDLNCDGRVNISDAVHLLRYLFQDGTAPCALAQDEVEARLAALEAAAKRTVSIATGSYVGDGKKSQKVVTGLSGKLRKVEIISKESGGGVRWDNFDWTGLDAITFADPDFTVNEHLVPGADTPGYPLNKNNIKYDWMAFSTPE